MEKATFHKLSYGLFIVSATEADGRLVGCVANTFQQVGSDPLMACVSLNKDNVTTQAIHQTGRFEVSVLTTSADMQLIGTFGFKSSHDVDKYADVSYALDDAGVPYITEHTNAHFLVEVQDTLDVGSHVVFIGCIKDAAVLSDEESLTYAYYHSVLRGKTPPKAVSYQKEENDAAVEAIVDAVEASATEQGAPPKYGWRCLICGFVIEVDELPDDFVCPVCGVGKDMFERFEL